MTRRGWLVLATILTVVAWLILPDPLFEIAAVFAVVVGSLVTAAYWYERAQHYYSDATWLATDLAASNARLAAVLDEHSRCPVPLKVVTNGPIPMQRREVGADEAKAIELGLARLRRSRGEKA